MTLIDFDTAPSASMRRWFGVSLAAVLLFFAFVLRHAATNSAIFLSMAAALTGMVYYGLPAAQHHFIRYWQRLTYPLTWLMSHLLLGTVFFAVLFPMAMIARMIGYDPLRLRRDGTSTNWTPRQHLDDITRYFEQF